MKKFSWQPKKGSFRKTQENHFKREVLKEEASPEQIAMSKKYKFNTHPDEIDVAWIKKNKLEKVWSRKSPHPDVMKIAKAFSEKIKKMGGVDKDDNKLEQLKKEMKGFFSSSKGWDRDHLSSSKTSLMHTWENMGAVVRFEPKWDDFVDIQDFGAKKEISIDAKTGKIKIKGGGMGGWPFPAANKAQNEEGGGFGYEEM